MRKANGLEMPFYVFSFAHTGIGGMFVWFVERGQRRQTSAAMENLGWAMVIS